jgi:hypothetical protein
MNVMISNNERENTSPSSSTYQFENEDPEIATIAKEVQKEIWTVHR